MRLWLWVVLCVGLAASTAFGQSGEEIIARVQKRLASYKTFSARFEKQFYWAVLDKYRSREGQIYLRRPNRFRIELEGGDVVVADGKAVWSYVVHNGQVVISPYEAEIKTPWEVFFDYTERYVPIAVEESALGGRSCYLLIMAPENKASVVEQMRVWVNPRGWLLLQVEQREANGNRTAYVLRDHRANRRIADEVFSFEVPEGVEVLDTRESPVE